MPNSKNLDGTSAGGGGGGFGRGGGRSGGRGRGNVYDIKTGKKVSKRVTTKAAKTQAREAAKSSHPATLSKAGRTVAKTPSLSRTTQAKRLGKRIANSPASRDLKKVTGNKVVRRTTAGVGTAYLAKKAYDSRPKPSPKPKPRQLPNIKGKSYSEIMKGYKGSAAQKAGMTPNDYYLYVTDPNFRWKGGR